MKILIVDDHAVVRDGVARVLGEQLLRASFGEANTRETALERIRTETWDAVVLDISLGADSGLDLLKEIKQVQPSLPILILSMHSEEQYARRAFKAGASGYTTKDSPRAELLNAVNAVMQGRRYVSPALADRLIVDIQKGTDGPPHETLSDREFEVMRLIASGRAVTQIARILSLSDKTVSTYRARILEKMGMKTNADITLYAIKQGLIQ